MSNLVFSEADWISSLPLGSKKRTAPAAYFRKAFKLTEKVKIAKIHVTALGLYECEVNGVPVSDSVFLPGWTDYEKRCPYQTYDVTGLLGADENVIGVILGDGWYSGHIGWEGRQNYGDEPLLLARLEVEYLSGAKVFVSTGADWKVRVGPILENDLLMGETYDARLELSGWSEPGFADSDWSPAKVANAPEIAIEPALIPPVRRIDVLSPLSVVDQIERLFPAKLYDFGQNFCGRCAIEVEAPAGTALTIRHGEILNPDGTLYTDNLREARATDVYVCKGGGVEEWEPRFTFHGFRYAEVTGLKAGMAFKIKGIVLHTDLKQTGEFQCSNPLLNQLQSNIRWSQKGNFLEVPTDCPQRDERLGWTGDAQIFAPTAAFNMDVSQFFTKWMRDLRDAQAPSGAISCVAPRFTRMAFIPFEDGGPGYSDAIVLLPWEIYLSYGNKAILEENYAAMRHYMEFLAQERCLGKIRGHHKKDAWGGYGDWLALDGSGKVEGGTPKDLVGTAFYAHLADTLHKIAILLCKPHDAEAFKVLHREIVCAFQNRFVTAEGIVASGTQTSYVLALKFHLLPDELRSVAAYELLREIERRDFHLATGFIGTPYLLDVLTECGYLDVAYRLMEQETFPSWLFPVINGATTIWERWDGWTPDRGMQMKGMNSFNHYAYGAVGAWMYRTIAGLNFDEREPGYAYIRFAPRPGGSITWAKASLVTPHGFSAIEWKKDANRFSCTLTVPEGARASFSAPEGFVYEGGLLEEGTHQIELSSLSLEASIV